MVQFLIILLELWKRRYMIILPIIILPLLALLYSVNKTPIFEASTAIHVNSGKARSPLLQNIKDSEHQLILARTLKSDVLIEETLTEAGILIKDSTKENLKSKLIENFKNNLSFNVNSNNLLRINYKSSVKEDTTTQLEILTKKFLSEILAPERFRLDQQQSQLAGQVKYYAHQVKLAEEDLKTAMKKEPENSSEDAKNEKLKELVSLEFNIQRLNAQHQLALEEYERILEDSKNLISQFMNNGSNQLLWYIEDPVIVSDNTGIKHHVSYMLNALFIAILLSVALIIYKHYISIALINDEEEAHAITGLKIIGIMPNLGNVRIEDGHLTADIRTSL